MRTHYCGHLNREHIGQTVTLCGWAHRRRDHGGVIFIDLRDREGMAQIVVNPDAKAAFAIAESVRSEYVLKVVCEVRARPEGSVNANLATGEVESNTSLLADRSLSRSLAIRTASLSRRLGRENLDEWPAEAPRTRSPREESRSSSSPVLANNSLDEADPALRLYSTSTLVNKKICQKLLMWKHTVLLPKRVSF